MLIIGLGNPGEKYEKTRHNAGRTIVRCFARKHSFPEFEYEKKRNALVSRGEIGGVPVELILPETFMNNSGDIFKNLSTYQLTNLSTNLIVVHDDLDLPIGTLKIVHNRSSAGHKGVESIMNALDTKDFTRVRAGIAPPSRPRGEEAVSRFVLQKFSPDEREKMKEACAAAGREIEALVAHT